MNQYKCNVNDFETLNKKIKSVIKKLEKYNLNYTYNILNESFEEVAVYNTDGREKAKVGTTIIKVMNYNFDMEQIKLGNFEVVAILDHTTKNEHCNNNMVYLTNENIEIPTKYHTIDGYCEHCNTNRKRNTTAILRNINTNELKQVGITCLKEYTGIDAIDIIKNYTEITDIINDLNELNCTNEKLQSGKQYIKVIEYLQKCITAIEKDGYKKGDTKNKAWEVEKKDISKTAIEKAKIVLDYFNNHTDYDNTFLNNIKTALKQEAICYPNGFIAYSYIAYQKEIEKEKEIADKQKNDKGYFGNIGDKVILKNITWEVITSWEYQIGYNNYTTTYLYKLTNENGHIFTWKTNKSLWWEQQSENKEHDYNFTGNKIIKELKGTIKDHTTFNNESQTELTRCKIKFI